MPHRAIDRTNPSVSRIPDAVRSSVKLHPVPVKAPCERWILQEPARARQRDKVEPQPLVRRIGPPETLVAPEVRQPTVDAHPGPGGQQNCAGPGNCSRSAVECLLDHRWKAVAGK